MDDRRSAHRVTVQLTATYRSSTTVSEGLVTDLSRQGLFIAGVPAECVGTAAEIDVELPETSLTLQGRVVRRVDGAIGVGISFDELGDEARRQVANIVLSAHSLG